jgi:hypothetical protein
MRSLFLLASVLLASAPATPGSQLLSAKASRQQLYWGAPFTIDVTIAPPETLADFKIEVIYPPGFQGKPASTAIPTSLAAGSTYTLEYDVTPPSSGHATTETYTIVFNVGYRHAVRGERDNREARSASLEPEMWQSLDVPFTATFSREKFYVWTILGLFFGWLIKFFSSYKFSSSAKSLAAANPAQTNPKWYWWLMDRPVSRALTSLTMGFLALLLLSRHELPTGAVHDSLALGIALGFLSDDQLLIRYQEQLKTFGI